MNIADNRIGNEGFARVASALSSISPLVVLNLANNDKKMDQLVNNNKKYIVSKISNELEDNWGHLGTQLLRRTVKKFIDGIRL